MIKKLLFLGCFFSLAGAYSMPLEYDLTIRNMTSVTFILLTKTCNGGIIISPPEKIPPAPETVNFAVQKDSGVGCMLIYSDQIGSKLGIWIQNHQVSCSNEGGFLSYRCIFVNDLLTIDR